MDSSIVSALTDVADQYAARYGPDVRSTEALQKLFALYERELPVVVSQKSADTYGSLPDLPSVVKLLSPLVPDLPPAKAVALKAMAAIYGRYQRLSGLGDRLDVRAELVRGVDRALSGGTPRGAHEP